MPALQGGLSAPRPQTSDPAGCSRDRGTDPSRSPKAPPRNADVRIEHMKVPQQNVGIRPLGKTNGAVPERRNQKGASQCR